MKVKVYKIQMYNPSTDEPIVSRRMATAEGAEMMLGTIIEESGVEIDESQLEPGMQWTARDFNPYAAGGFPRQVRT